MTLPKRPERTSPIPNEPFESPKVSTIRGPYWDMPLGSGLEDDGQGSVQTAGSDPSAPTAYLYGSNGFVGLGTGLQLGPNGELEQGGGYIYCTPQYSYLPVTYPPYNCETEVNTTGVTDFTDAWFNCQYLTEFPCVDSSAVTDFSYAWEYCYSLTSFPTINTGAGENFSYSWAYTGLTSFPKLNTSKGSIFYYAWAGCYYLMSFPEIDTSSGIDFGYAWYGCDFSSFPETLDLSSGENFRRSWLYCTSLTTFPHLDLSSGTNFSGAWGQCTSLTTFPHLDLSSGTNFSWAWEQCASLTTFPETLDLSSGINFDRAWGACTSLTSFPLLDVGSGETFNGTWSGCSSLTTFPAGMFDSCSATDFAGAWIDCALSQQSVDNILISLDTAGQSNGSVWVDRGTSSVPGPAGLAAKASLEARGWTVLTN